MACHATKLETSNTELFKGPNLHHGCIRKDFHADEVGGPEDKAFHRCPCGAVWVDTQPAVKAMY